MADIQAQAPFEFDAELTAVANVIVNESFIADRVLPRIPLRQETYKYLEIPRGEMLTVPETLVGREGEPNEVRFSGKRRTGSVEGHALVVKVPTQDQEQAQPDFNPRANSTTGVTRLMLLRKERSMADHVFNAGNYAADNKETLGAADQWNNPASDPLRKIREIMDEMVMRPNIMVVGQLVATQLMLHDRIIKAFHGTEGGEGRVTLAYVAQLLGLDEVLVGGAWYNAKQLGQDVSLSRVWQKHAALLHRSNQATMDPDGFMQILSWGCNFIWPVNGQDLAVFSWFDPKPGVNGIDWVKVASRYNHDLIANDFGYLIQNAVA